MTVCMGEWPGPVIGQLGQQLGYTLPSTVTADQLVEHVKTRLAEVERRILQQDSLVAEKKKLTAMLEAASTA